MFRGSVNKVILVGRLGADPEIRYAPSGAPVANFNIATDRNWKDKDGNWQTETMWHRIVVWNRQAELVKEHVKKGNRVFIEGRIQYREWEDQNGQRRFTTEIIANDIQLLESGSRQGMVSDEPSPEDTLGTPPEDSTPDQPDDVPF
ncbi:MAG: single-stranded DNA-binding protein [Calditrichaeota bacterium]|nr:MAG: single-stranded DNA-binding protein [Calditrichota bacterium]